MRERLSNESGMTLIEMLIATAVLGIIIGPLTASLLLGYANAEGTRERLSDSAAAQIVSAYFPLDGASAEQVTIAAPGPCVAPAKTWLTFTWTDPVDGAIEVVYRQPCGTSRLERIRTTAGTPGPTTELMENFIGLEGACDADNGDCVTYDYVEIELHAEADTDNAVYGGYDFTLRATRRTPT